MYVLKFLHKFRFTIFWGAIGCFIGKYIYLLPEVLIGMFFGIWIGFLLGYGYALYYFIKLGKKK